MMLPISRFFVFSFSVIVKIMPIAARTGAKDDGFKSCTHTLALSIPVKESSQEVTVVPIFAPIIIPTACESCMMPEFTKPTTITVVAEDDWITAVTAAPSNTAMIRFFVSFSKICSILPPESFASPSPMTFIPNRNIARPPINVSTPKMSIDSPSCFTYFSFIFHTFHITNRM